MDTSARNKVLAGTVGLAIFGMVGASFAAVPLYRLFCAATGYAGTPNIGPTAAPGSTRETVRVRFNADTNPALPWTFAPDQLEVSLKLGEEKVAFYHATNLSSQPVAGMALYNVTPEKVGKFFHKTACFCFNQQNLLANQSMEFPVSFWVDPAIRADPNTADVKVITLSYTFFRSPDGAPRSGASRSGASKSGAPNSDALAKAGPHVGPMSAAELRERSNAN